MKKSLLLLAAIVTTLAFAGTACAWWDCYEMPPCKVVCVDEVLCKGAAAGAIKLCGPCAPVIAYKGSWLTMCVCPAGAKLPVVAKVRVKK